MVRFSVVCVAAIMNSFQNKGCIFEQLLSKLQFINKDLYLMFARVQILIKFSLIYTGQLAQALGGAVAPPALDVDEVVGAEVGQVGGIEGDHRGDRSWNVPSLCRYAGDGQSPYPKGIYFLRQQRWFIRCARSPASRFV